MSADPLAVQRTPIPGLLLVSLPLHGDERGWFKENWERTKMTAAGVPDFGPVQQNISYNEQVGTTRGIHAEPWDKWISVATGRVFGAWVDLRDGPSFGTVFTAEIDPSRAVFNFHCPPLDSSLDTCLKLDASVWPPTPVIENGQAIYYGAGSQSVADALSAYQPTVGVHGHIHESRGVTNYGRTMAFNPGSEYGEGVLRGLIVAIRGGEVIGHQFTSG